MYAYIYARMKLVSLISVTLALATRTAVAQTPNSKWNIQNMKTLVTFGDSYTDESRLNYFEDHKGEAPPVGWIAPEVGSRDLLLLFFLSSFPLSRSTMDQVL